MLTPDLERACRFLAVHPPPGVLLQCGITGAHYYGFPSPDSDVDLSPPRSEVVVLASACVSID